MPAKSKKKRPENQGKSHAQGFHTKHGGIAFLLSMLL